MPVQSWKHKAGITVMEAGHPFIDCSKAHKTKQAPTTEITPVLGKRDDTDELLRIATARKVVAELPRVEITPEECPVGDHQANGHAESAVKETKKKLKRMTLKEKGWKKMVDDLEAKVAESPASEEKSKEAHDVKFKCSPCRPNATEVAKHDKTHLPYRSWCPVCVRAKGEEDAHPRARKGKDDATGFPVISMDYELLEEKLALLIVKDEDSGSTLCYDCLTKGPGDAWVCRQLVRDLEGMGRGDICLKTDGEASMLALQKALQTMRLSRTLPRNPPAYNPPANGGAEKAVQDVTGHIRTLKLALEARLKISVPVEHPMMK
jgi:hypothetical protein